MRTVIAQNASEVLVIGGGLAGMYSAIAAAENGARVTILCKSKTGAGVS